MLATKLKAIAERRSTRRARSNNRYRAGQRILSNVAAFPSGGTYFQSIGLSLKSLLPAV
jgi:hypothetical protein